MFAPRDLARPSPATRSPAWRLGGCHSQPRRRGVEPLPRPPAPRPRPQALTFHSVEDAAVQWLAARVTGGRTDARATAIGQRVPGGGVGGGPREALAAGDHGNGHPRCPGGTEEPGACVRGRLAPPLGWCPSWRSRWRAGSRAHTAEGQTGGAKPPRGGAAWPTRDGARWAVTSSGRPPQPSRQRPDPGPHQTQDPLARARRA